MSNRLFQTVIHQMKDVLGRTIGVIDENGIIIACSEVGKIGESRQRIREELTYSHGAVFYEGYSYRFITASGKNDCIAFAEGTDTEADKTTQLLSIALGNIKSLYDEKYDKGSFIKNIILDNILPSDIYVKSNELHFTNDECRAVFVVKFFGTPDTPPYEIVESVVTDSKDYVISISEQDIVIVKEVDKGTVNEDLEVFAKDLRCGAALLCAALAAEGKSLVHGSAYVERGYERIEDAFSFLGGNIRLQDR